MDEATLRAYFRFFNEIGIIAQLSRTAFEARMPNGLTVPHFSVLNHLVRLGDGKTPLQLARAFQVPKPSMTNTLAGLESRGLIETIPNPDDRRSKLVRLTPEGRTFREKAINQLAPEMALMAEAITEAEIAELSARLADIRVLLDENRPALRD